MLGSFYNVVGLRVPQKQSLIHPPSHCPGCQNRLRAVDLVPVFSYIFLGGKCRFCRQRISPLYSIIELATACLFVAAAYIVGVSSELFVAWALISLLMIIFVSDIRYMLIPDKVVAFFAVVFLLLRLWVAPFAVWWQPLLGAAVAFMVVFVVAVVSRGNMGGGDIKLFTALGLALGWKGVLLAFFFSTFYGSLIGGIGLIIGKVKRGKPMPFGPFIVLGALTAYFYGDVLLNWYLHHL